MKRTLGHTVYPLVALLAVLLLYPMEAANAEGRSLQDVQSSGSLVVGVDIPYGVMEFYDADGKPAGIDIDVAKEIAAALGVVPEFRAMPFDDLFGALEDDSVDLVISAVTITPERQQRLLFSAPYLSASTVLAVAAANTTVESFDDLAGASLGVLKGTLGEDLARSSDLLKGMNIVPYEDNARRVDDLVSGKLDAAIVHFLVKTDLPIKVIGEPLRQNFYGVVANMESSELMAAVDKVLRDMKRNGKIAAIKRRYID